MKEIHAAALEISEETSAKDARCLTDKAIKEHESIISTLKAGRSRAGPCMPPFGHALSNVTSDGGPQPQLCDGPLPLPDAPSEGSAQTTTYKAIQFHEDAILALKYQRNGYANTACVPPELLLEIFSIVRKDEIGYWGYNPWIGRLTHICRDWRKIAVESPRLWAAPPLNNYEWTVLMLERAKGVPLTFVSGLGTSTAVIPGLQVALQNGIVERSQRMILNLGPQVWDNFKFPKFAPFLESLALVGSPANHHFVRNEFRRVPNLRHLRLSFFTFNLKTHAPLLRNLSSLHLHHVSYARMTWRMFVDMFQFGMPNLQELYLDNAFPHDLYEKVTWDPVYLASLRELTIFCRPAPAEQLAMVLKCIAYPPDVKKAFDSGN